MAMSLRVREQKRGYVAGFGFRADGFVRVLCQGTCQRKKHVSRRGGKQNSVRCIQFMGKHDDALRVGRASKL